ncbi:MAG: AEC family transporter [Corynebacterium sp.]|nr:AEC family transporter [Corynebacterium sp.]
MLGVLEGFAIILTVIFIGYLLSQFRVITSDDQRLVLNRIAFYAATPALIFMVVSQSSREAFFSQVILVEAITALVTAGIFVLISRRFFPADRASTVMGAAATAYVNSNNIGLPVGIYVLGNGGYVAPLLVVQMIVFTPLILALISESKTEVSRARKIGKAVLTGLFSPIVVGAALGMVVGLTNTQLPEAIMEPIKILGGASIPMILMSFGASLGGARPLSDPQQRTAALTATALKTVGMPLISIGLGLLWGLRGDELYAVAILSALPTAQNVYNYAATYQRGMVVTRDTVLLSTFLALPVMLIIAAAFGR